MSVAYDHKDKFVKMGRGGKLVEDIAPNRTSGEISREIDGVPSKIELSFRLSAYTS